MGQDTATAERIATLLGRARAGPLGGRLALAAEVARQQQTRVYLVGGAVRDLYLTGEIRDLDLLVAGNGASFARQLAEQLEAEVVIHPEFLTAEVLDRQGERIDVTSARTEIYAEPAALPIVTPGTVEEDLARRDFTVNTLAARLDAEEYELLDHFDGARDLENRLLRVLHAGSFSDDPTRILRGVRLEFRLDFSLELRTEELAREAVERGIFKRLSGVRLQRELALLLDEPGQDVRRARRLADLGLLDVLHSGLQLTAEVSEALGRLDAELRSGDRERDPSIRRWVVSLMALARPLSAGERRALAERLQLAGEIRDMLDPGIERVEQAAKRLARGEIRPHEIDSLLESFSREQIWLLTLLGDVGVKEMVRHWQRELRGLRLAITGEDLLDRGVPEGPGIGWALGETRKARLEGAIGASDELEFALQRLRDKSLVDAGVEIMKETE